ncbi:Ku protein [Microvirga antarctica]|uniref:non-homologous end joining protein Ku n=1 Tax=Microvirga antarctica TaxID=2819233 RepID=UPI001B30333D|nr:Ku protein [Microvirga antarctica]
MAPKTFWKGYLKLSFVTCAVTMTPAVSEGEKVKFHTLNRATGNRIESRYVDSETGAVVEGDDEVKGYEVGENEYVILEDDELEAVKLESTRTIEIDMFVPKDSIEWIWYDRPHYLMPADSVAREAYSVVREAMKATDMVGISRVVLYRRERAVMLEPRDNGIVLWTLRYGDEVRKEDVYFDEIEKVKVEPPLKAMVTTLIKERSRKWDPAMVRDPVQLKLKDIIAAKSKRGGKPAARKKPGPERPNNVVNIMDALKKSLAAETGKKAPPKRK